jgi:predicted kinase
MDLDARGYRALASWLAAGYAREAADAELERLLPFYAAYRALVRAKVAAIAATEPELAADAGEAERREAIRYAALAAGYGLPPGLVLTCGLPGTGKTTIAALAATALGAEHLRSDVVRKELAGLAPTDRAEAGFEHGIYSPEMSERTHASLCEAAERVLRSGRPVVVDATSATAARRRPFRDLAERLGAPFVLVETVAPAEVVEERLRRRAAEDDDASDADLTIYRSLRERYEPPVEIDRRSLARSDAREAPEDGLLRLVDRLVGL